MKNFISLQGIILIIGVFLFGISILTNVLLYSSLSDDGLYRATYSGMGLAFDLSKLCLSLVIGILFYAFRAYIFAAIASIFWLALTLLSITTAFGFMAVVMDSTESKTLSEKTAFKSLNAAVEDAQSHVNSLSSYADPILASRSAAQIKNITEQLNAFRNGPAKNSRGKNAGSIVSRVGDCLGGGYYIRTYCPQIRQYEQDIAEQKRIVSDHNLYLGAVAAKNARMTELSNIDAQNVGSGHIHPMFVGIALLTGASATEVKYIFLCISSILCELLGSFLFILYSRLGVDQSATEYAKQRHAHNYSVNTVATQSPPQHKPIPISSISSNSTQGVKTIEDGVFIALCDDIKNRTIDNLSYKSIQKWGRERGVSLNQPRVKELREALNEKRIAVYDNTKKLVLV
jgi:hypothetical protein